MLNVDGIGYSNFVKPNVPPPVVKRCLAVFVKYTVLFLGSLNS